MDINGLNTLNAYRAQMDRSSTGLGRATSSKTNGVSKTHEGTQAAETTKSSDTVSVSSDGSLRTVALSTAMNSSNVRQEKVDNIKQKVTDGTYTIDSRKIATKLIMDDRALLAR